MGLFYKVSVLIYIWSKLVQDIVELSKLALTEMVQIGPNLPKVALKLFSNLSHQFIFHYLVKVTMQFKKLGN